MMQTDWVGGVDTPPFIDIRPQRASVAEEKACLSYSLRKYITKAPPKIATGGSVNLVREWQAARAQAAKVANNTRASVQMLRSAITNVDRFWR